MKRFYECTFIVNPGLDDAQIESTVKTAEDTIVKNGGEIVNTEHIGRRRLAYPIAKKHNGFYVSVEFTAEGRIVDKVERFLKLDENVMRFLTLTLDDRELEAKRTRTAFAAQDRARGRDSQSDSKDEKKEESAEKKEAAAEKKVDEKKTDEKKDAEPAEKSESGDAEDEKKEKAAAEESTDDETGKSDDNSEKTEDSKE